jgi:hypothetical protein
VRSTDHVPVWVRLAYSLRAASLFCLPLPLDKPREAVPIRVDKFLLISAANDDSLPK